MKDTNLNRRQWLLRSMSGLALTAGVQHVPLIQPVWAGDPERHPLAPRASHHLARAKRVIFFFMTGGVSHVDSFDPKPELNKRDGQPSVRNGRNWKAALWPHKPRGQSGIEVTDLFPHIADRADDLCLIRSMHADHGDHFEATLHMHSGSDGSVRPSIGSWVSYALGTMNPNLPSFVAFVARKPYAGAQVWDSHFLPAYHQGVRITPGDEPIPHLTPHADTAGLQNKELQMLERLNQQHLQGREHVNDLAARKLSFTTAQSLQEVAPEVFDLRGESKAMLDLYGVRGRGDNSSFAWQVLMARRLAERGVRFIELIDTGANRNWDQHSNMPRHGELAKVVDRPIAALLQDLQQRGMFDDTLVVWCTEFGRTPFEDSDPSGRGHWREGFTCWLAGGGAKRGYVHGATDELGLRPEADPVHTHDFHATLLHLLGLNHKKLTYRHAGRDWRLTDEFGRVVTDVIA
ncbi:MAG: DUF1501 domain-containing protein [Planctomycetaceae bacterium]|nr:MAG: DUF1501 domain-containing protein [Planctomycetaceae bacterium]